MSAHEGGDAAAGVRFARASGPSALPAAAIHFKSRTASWLPSSQPSEWGFLS